MAGKKKTAAPEAALEAKKVYEVISLTDSNGFVLEAVYRVSGVVAEALINKGLVKLK